MRKAWMVMGQERGSKSQGGHMDAGFSGGVRDAEGKEVKRPGLGTTSFETINRFTTNRLFAERTHVTKLLVLYGLLFVAVSPSFSGSCQVSDYVLTNQCHSGLCHS